MFKLAKPVFLICETPLHAGSGSELGVVDLPIQRERHTDFPKIESSSLKGGIREAFEKPRDTSASKILQVGKEQITPFKQDPSHKKYEDSVLLTFGPEESGNDNYAGALGFTDARLLLFSVKSMKGVFAWITCPKVLQRFATDLTLCEDSALTVPPLPEAETVPYNCSLFVKDDKIVLEEYTFSITKDEMDQGNCSKLAEWLSNHLFPAAKADNDPYTYWREKLKIDLVVLKDDDFRDFVTLSTEVVTRIRIEPATGTVAKGALFTEEFLPSESVMYSLVLASPIFRKDEDKKDSIFVQNGTHEETLVMQFFEQGLPEVIQLGGDATIGKGIIRTHIMKKES
ncbi:CRISPR-associated RAMP protein, Cmr4 family [Candidatus Vecturithrix granuli]|uniref:CRISPR-associated RAMP protein, Cmr4 family n=1 Tax=Vecturithrix granuli TaxID=1499967 RepID=A0A081CAL0_VECG1|nr:CRISPR-associated RAMP protein, Cmr4 family [Candidatus Vecturithrix granuli]